MAFLRALTPNASPMAVFLLPTVSNASRLALMPFISCPSEVDEMI